ncbi:hypothetical protein PR048_014654 [Dryococelus australis]|uniref:Uncharacterized protein n=1 Tax=Dryococelus australis TaxID=614101 RepID=A0ABQ9HEU2_9NEOP|nr:hypothetical protein PR048_014654 [Dryococelus australis]
MHCRRHLPDDFARSGAFALPPRSTRSESLPGLSPSGWPRLSCGISPTYPQRKRNPGVAAYLCECAITTRLIRCSWKCKLPELTSINLRATKAQRLTRSPPTKVNEVRYLTESHPSFFSHVAILLDETDDRRVFSEIFHFPRHCIPELLRTHLASSSSAFKTSMLTAAQTLTIYPTQSQCSPLHLFHKFLVFRHFGFILATDNIWAALNTGVLRAYEGERSENRAAPQCKGEGNGRSPRKPADQRRRPAHKPRCENLEVTAQGIEPGSARIDTENCCTIRIQSRTGDRDEVHLEPPKLAVINLDLRSASIFDKCISPYRRMNKVTMLMAMLILHKAGKYTTRIQVDLEQGFQKCPFYRARPIILYASGATSGAESNQMAESSCGRSAGGRQFTGGTAKLPSRGVPERRPRHRAVVLGDRALARAIQPYTATLNGKPAAEPARDQRPGYGPHPQLGGGVKGGCPPLPNSPPNSQTTTAKMFNPVRHPTPARQNDDWSSCQSAPRSAGDLGSHVRSGSSFPVRLVDFRRNPPANQDARHHLSVRDASAGHLAWWRREAGKRVVQLSSAEKHVSGGGRVSASAWLSRLGHSLSSGCDELDERKAKEIADLGAFRPHWTKELRKEYTFSNRVQCYFLGPSSSTGRLKEKDRVAGGEAALKAEAQSS